MPLMLVENQEPNPTILHVPGEQPFVWQTKGDPRGGDVQRVPDSLVDSMQFIHGLENGHLAVLDASPEVRDKLAALQLGNLGQDRRAQAAQARSADLAVISRRQDRDMLGVPCLGPGPRGQEGGCSNTVVQRASRESGAEPTPPLCPAHVHTSDEYSLSEVPLGRGQTQTIWTRVTTR